VSLVVVTKRNAEGEERGFLTLAFVWRQRLAVRGAACNPCKQTENSREESAFRP